MGRKLLEIAADIVQAQAARSSMSPSDVEEALVKAFITLQKMQKAEEGGLLLAGGPAEEAPREEKAFKNPQDSIMDDKVICLECGAEMRLLSAKHLSTHDLSPKEYRKKYGFLLKTPLAAKSLTKARSKAAKKRGLPENLLKYQEQKRQMKLGVEAPPEAPPATGAPEVAEEKTAPKARGRRRKVA